MALYLKVVADIAKQVKFITAGPTASWLWLAGVGHCRLSSTDGFIPDAVVPTLVPGLTAPMKHAARLVEARLWTRVAGGYEVHDYLAWNPSRAELEEMRRVEAERKRVSRSASVRHLSERTDSRVQTDAPRVRADAPRAGASSPSVSPSGSEEDSEESARETTAPVWRTGARRADPAMRDLDYHRRNCPTEGGCWAQAACRAGICVPKYLWQQWERRQPTEALRGFVDAWASQAAGDKAEKFWPWAFEQHFGSVAPRDEGRGHRAWQPAPVTEGEDWFSECQRLHEGVCGGRMKHYTRTRMDAEREAAKSAEVSA